MPDVFISFTNDDVIVANALRRFLSSTLPDATGISLSSQQVEIEDEWLQKIREALMSAKVVLALFSREAIKRRWVNFEAGGAWFSTGKKS